jgi:hypothetical protein
MLRAATARTVLPTSMKMASRFNMRHHRTALRMPDKSPHRRAATLHRTPTYLPINHNAP